jgi:STE24 endopeptidase
MVPAQESRQLLVETNSMEKIIFITILAIVILDFIVERTLDFLNTKRWTDSLPAELEGICDSERYRKSQLYLKVNHKFSQVTETFNITLVLIMLFAGGFAYLDHLIRQYTVNPVAMALLFFGVLGFIADILGTPFSIYATFVIEERFGFNKTSVKTFLFDKIKGWILAILIGGGLLSLVVWIYGATGQWFWLIAWGLISFFTVLMTLFYSNLIVPLFNKQAPLEAGELRVAIENFAVKTGFKLKNIFVIDGSKRSTKANAYFTGIGKKKRIVLYDTLIKDHTIDELVAVLAHEIGHYKKKHTLSGTILSVLQTGFILFILSRFLGNPHLSGALGASEPSFHLSVLAFGILYTPLSVVLSLAMNALSRKHEYQADHFAASNFNAKSLCDALVKLSVNNLSNLRPHPVYVFFYYSHPPLLKRLQRIRQAEAGS